MSARRNGRSWKKAVGRFTEDVLFLLECCESLALRFALLGLFLCGLLKFALAHR
jgi:hypothetical protein